MLRCPTCHALVADDHDHCPDDGSALESPSDSRLGMTLEGDITLRATAGGGAMGSVFEGWQAAMERRVAVKMLHNDLSRDEVFVERFLREARAVARLNHPNIVTVHAVGQAGDNRYIVMEFIEGETLSEHIKRGPMSEIRTIRIARQIASALADAHAANIIHRDLKPANVLLSQRRRAADFVKILDFGVAKIVDADSALTREGFVFGTPAYLSPEQANGVDLDGRTDLYSLGVMMFEMLTGELPFEGNQVQLLLAHAKDQAPPVASRRPSVDAALASVVDRLLAKHPDDRPASAEALADELDALLGGDSGNPWASTALRASGSAEASAADSLTITSNLGGPVRRRPETPPTALEVPVAPSATVGPSVGRPGRPALTAALLVFAGLALLGAGASAAAFGPLRAELPIWPLGIEALPPPGQSIPDSLEVIPPDEVRYDAPRTALMFSQDGYSLRVQHPSEPEVGETYEFTIDIWGPTGEPLDLEELDVKLEGLERETSLRTITNLAGSYAVRYRFSRVGDYTLLIFLPEADSSVKVHFEVD